MVLHEMADALRALDEARIAERARVDQAIAYPEQVYAAPSDVLLDPLLTRTDKIAALSNWRADLELRSVARGEGMVGLPDEDLARTIAALSAALGLVLSPSLARGIAWTPVTAQGRAVSAPDRFDRRRSAGARPPRIAPSAPALSSAGLR